MESADRNLCADTIGRLGADPPPPCQAADGSARNKRAHVSQPLGERSEKRVSFESGEAGVRRDRFGVHASGAYRRHQPCPDASSSAVELPDL